MVEPAPFALESQGFTGAKQGSKARDVKPLSWMLSEVPICISYTSTKNLVIGITNLLNYFMLFLMHSKLNPCYFVLYILLRLSTDMRFRINWDIV